MTTWWELRQKRIIFNITTWETICYYPTKEKALEVFNTIVEKDRYKLFEVSEHEVTNENQS